MKTISVEEYEPFGDEWKKEISKMTKPMLVNLLRQKLIDLQNFKYRPKKLIDEINKNTKPLIEEIADLKSRLELSEQKVKLNYNTAIDLESKLKASGSVNEGLKSDVDFWKNKSFTLQQENLKHTL